jgi:septum formation protein
LRRPRFRSRRNRDVEVTHHTWPEEVLEPGANRGRRAFDLPLPGAIACAHAQRRPVEQHVGGASDSGAHRCAPGEAHLVVRQWCLADNRREGGGNDRLNRDHACDPTIIAMTSRPLDRIILASASPRRAELLRAAGIDFDVRPADIDEAMRPGEAPGDYVSRLAEAKARAVHERDGNQTVLAADTAVVVDGQILGKPMDEADAKRMLRMIGGRTHEVLTAVSIFHPGEIVDTRMDATTVEFAELSDPDIEWYVSSGEPMDKAGAYAVQGLASRFVTRVEGSYSNVVGLPIALVYRMLTNELLTF